MIVHTLPIPHPLTLTPIPLSQSLFSPYGEVLCNPNPSRRPTNTTPSIISQDPVLQQYNPITANQGTAIQYKNLAPNSLRSFYSSAPSQAAAAPRMTMFVCSARLDSPATHQSGSSKDRTAITVQILERHPFTTQTFIPLTADPRKRYLVVVAPTLPPTVEQLDDKNLPAPSEHRSGGLPGRGMPDLNKLQAFIATAEQAVTYGAGTWHAPMVALGPEDTTVDFIVVQFANDFAVEDCQEVVLDSAREETGPRITVRLAESSTSSKL